MPHDFPTIVYRCPGAWPGPPGTTYASVGVEDADQLRERLAESWHRSIPEAVAAFLLPEAAPEPAAEPVAEPVVGEIVEPDDDAPPTREEMEAKARELGVKFDGRTSDARLLAKIDDALRAAAPADAAPADEDPI